jgi:hypothetical protein
MRMETVSRWLPAKSLMILWALPSCRVKQHNTHPSSDICQGGDWDGVFRTWSSICGIKIIHAAWSLAWRPVCQATEACQGRSNGQVYGVLRDRSTLTATPTLFTATLIIDPTESYIQHNTVKSSGKRNKHHPR